MKTTEQYLDIIKMTRADKALVYDYTETEYLGNDAKIAIGCYVHGKFEQRAGDHRRGSGCPRCGRESAKLTNLQKYGVENPAQSPMIKQKIKETFINNYGVDNPSKCDFIKEKKSSTCLKNYGVSSPMQSRAIRKKTEETNIIKYGAKVPTQNKTVAEKGIATKIANGGFTKANSSKEATTYINEYINNKGYIIDQCAFADCDKGLHEWGIYHNGRWILYDLVVFEIGHRGDKTQVVEILEYHGPFHYTDEDVITRGSERAYPWKSNKTTISESVERDNEKESLGRSLTNNYTIIRKNKEK